MPLSAQDLFALTLFLVVWIAYEPALSTLSRGRLINADMVVIRQFWMQNMAHRKDSRLMDGQLLGHALNSASFFASSNLILIAAVSSALFGGEHTFKAASSLALIRTSSRLLFEGQVALVLVTLARGLLSFIWSIRQMNYCIAALGAVPEAPDPEFARAYGDAAGRLINPALAAFNAGVRGYYFALAAAAWLFGPWAFIAATLGATGLLLWRQRSSPSAKAVRDLRRLLERR